MEQLVGCGWQSNNIKKGYDSVPTQKDSSPEQTYNVVTAELKNNEEERSLAQKIGAAIKSAQNAAKFPIERSATVKIQKEIEKAIKEYKAKNKGLSQKELNKGIQKIIDNMAQEAVEKAKKLDVDLRNETPAGQVTLALGDPRAVSRAGRAKKNEKTGLQAAGDAINDGAKKVVNGAKNIANKFRKLF